jgi:sirohydrochlorin cobaltochelatase
MSTQGLILFAHGARDARWSAPFEAVARQIQVQRPALVLRLAFLELMAPSLHDAGEALCAAGCSTVEVLPLFLGTGGHLRRTAADGQAAARAVSGGALDLHPAVGEHEW